MAEGWARDWIRMQQEQGRKVLVHNTVVASIALDASAVFDENCETCCGDACHTRQERKSVKLKAVQAMAMDGVDISSFYPKTLGEILPGLRKPACSTSMEYSLEKPIDALIVLCSCGSDTRNNLSKESKSIQEWNVEAPTAAAKVEGESAYRRVSLEIRDRVHSLMEDLHQEMELVDDSGDKIVEEFAL